MKRWSWIGFCLSTLLFAPAVFADDVVQLHYAKQVYVGFSPASLFSFASYNHPLSLGYFINPAILVGVSSGSSRDDFHRAGIQYTSQESSLWARYFLINHLDLLARVRTLDLNYSRRYNSASTGLNVNYSGTFKSQSLGLGVGNRWVWPSGLSVGVDWLVANGIVGSSSQGAITSNEGVPSAEAQQALARDSATVERFAGLPSVAVFSLGYVF